MRIFLIAFCLFSTPLLAQSNTEYRYLHFNPVMSSKDAFDVIGECSNSEPCVAAVAAGAAYFGVDPTKVLIGVEVVKHHYNRQGEETWWNIHPRDGRAWCRARLEYTSVSPAAGGDMPKTTISVAAGWIGWYAHTRKSSDIGKRTWVDATLTLEEVDRTGLEELIEQGRCSLPIEGDDAYVYKCGGRGCSGRGF